MLMSRGQRCGYGLLAGKCVGLAAGIYNNDETGDKLMKTVCVCVCVSEYVPDRGNDGLPMARTRNTYSVQQGLPSASQGIAAAAQSLSKMTD